MAGLYSTPQWRALRSAQLHREPLCRMCKAQGKLTAATVVDHVQPHRGNPALFFDPDNLQSLDKRCHDSVKQSFEKTGRLRGVNAEGWPIDPSHPWNK